MLETLSFDNLPPVDKRDTTPRHLQVQRILRDLIVRGVLRPGDKIPAELDVAAALGVSKMTVNKALLALTADGYFVREVGRGTFVAPPPGFRKTNSPPRIVLSFVEGAQNILESDYYGTLYRGIVDALTGRNVEVSLEVALTPLDGNDVVSEEILGRLVIAPRREAVPVIRQLWQQGRMVVVLGAAWPELTVPIVDSDNIGGAAAAVRHLLDRGHRRIALLYGEEETTNIQDRILGYRQALDQAGRTPDPTLEIRADGAWNVGDEARERLRRLLDGPEPVTAIFAVGHYLALEAKNVVRAGDRRIPDEVSVVGYDDPVSAQLVHPALTTVRQPLYEMGRRAAERLLRLIQGEEIPAPTRDVLAAELIVRASSGPAPETNRR